MTQKTMKQGLTRIAALLVIGLAGSCGGTVYVQSGGDGGSRDGTASCGESGEACCYGTACNNGLRCNGGHCMPEGGGLDSSPPPFDSPSPLDVTPPSETGFAEASPGCVPPPSGIVSWWTGDRTYADVEGLNPGTPAGSVTFVPGMVREAFHFDGSSHVEASSTSMPVGSADRTLELWARFDTVPRPPGSIGPGDERYLAGYGAFGSDGEVYLLTSQDNPAPITPVFSQWGNGINGPGLTLGKWHHIAVTNVGSSATLYVDADPVGPSNMDIATAPGTMFYIGQVGICDSAWSPACGSSGDLSRALVGAVDEVTVYNRALAATEVASIYTAGSAGKCH